jgi:hypothetical protein
MLFRPKEIDTASGEGPVSRPLAQWDISVRADFQWNLAFNNTIAHEYSDGISTWVKPHWHFSGTHQLMKELSPLARL